MLQKLSVIISEIRSRNISAFLAIVFIMGCVTAYATPSGTILYSQNFEGTHGWTLNVATGAQGADPNFWVVSDGEGGVLPPGCGENSNGNKTLHITSVFNPTGGAAYDAGGLCGFLFCPQSNSRAESPSFSTSGYTNINFSFDYIAGGEGLNDNASVWINTGSGWTQLVASLKSSVCSGGRGQWTHYSMTLPVSAENNPSVKIGFGWVNNDDGIGTDPSVAINNVRVETLGSNIAPSYTLTSPQAITVCRNAPASDIKYLMHISDADMVQEETFTFVDGPSHGYISGVSSTTTSGSNNITPQGAYNYMPVPGYSGNDTFTVRVSDGVATADMVVYVTVSGPTVSITTTNVSCNGGSNGEANAVVTGGTYPFAYLWNVGSATSSISSLSPANYHVDVVDGYGCTDSASVTITQPAALTSSVTTTNVAVYNGTTGSATVSVTGGVSPYAYSWTFGVNTATATGLAAGTYTATITDANGCQTTATATITQPEPNIAPAFILSTPQAISLCRNPLVTDLKPYLHVSDTDATQTLTWTQQSGPAHGTLVVTGATATSGSDNRTPGGIITYKPATDYAGSDAFTIRVSDGIASSDMVFNIWVNDLTVNTAVTNVSCNGGSNGSLFATATGGVLPYDYFWSTGATGRTLSGLHANSYDAIVYDGMGCMADEPVAVSEPAVLAASMSATNVSCNGGSNGTVTAMVTGGTTPYTYTWSPAGGTLATATGLGAGSYTVTVTDAHSCTATASITVTEPVLTTASISGTTSVCNNTGTEVYFSSADGAVVNYKINGGTTQQVEIGVAGIDSVATGNITAAASYDLVSVTMGGCTYTATGNATVSVYPQATVNSIADQFICNNATTNSVVFDGPVSGTTFTWAANNTSIGLAAAGADSIGAFAGTNTTTAIQTATITVTPTANGCVGTTSDFTITVYPTPMLTSTLTPSAICNNTTFSYVPASATTGTTYQWSRAAVTGISDTANNGTDDPEEALHNTTANPVVVTYVYTLTANGCANTQDVTVAVNPTPVLSSTLTSAPICNNTIFHYTPASATTGTAFSWSRAAVTGISNTANTGNDDPAETLSNTTAAPILVTYVYTLAANGCSNIQNVAVTVNPTPVMSTTLTAAPVCDSSLFSYEPASATVGTTYQWSRATVTGISNAAATGADNPGEYLVNTTADPVNVQYVYTVTANSCTNTQAVTVTVYPKPLLSTSLTPAAICDSTMFAYTPNSLTAGTTYVWSRDAVAGISNPANADNTDPDETLDNTIVNPVAVTYVYNLTANGCHNIQNVTVIVNPTPKLSSSMTGEVCSTAPFSYSPASATTGVSYAWTRAVAAGISNAAGIGSGNVNETLVNTTLAAKTTTYRYTLTANGCSNIQNVVVTVDPTPQAPVIAVTAPANVCSQTMNMNFGAATTQPDTVQYTWTANGATVLAQGAGHQNTIVSFPEAGNAIVVLTANAAGFSCTAKDTFAVTVSNSVANNAEVYYIHDHFLYTDNTVSTYQWGYDDATTLDSVMFSGQVDQNYFDASPDFTNKNYWVMTTKDGCMSKTYYNAPTSVVNVGSAAAVTLTVVPNPASDYVSVAVQGVTGNNDKVELTDLTGKTVATELVAGNKAQLNVSNLASGIYIVTYYNNGVKAGTAKLVKE